MIFLYLGFVFFTYTYQVVRLQVYDFYSVAIKIKDTKRQLKKDVKKVLCKGYLWREAKTFPGEKRKHYQPTYNGKFSVGMHKHSKRWRSTLPKKKLWLQSFKNFDNAHWQKSYCRKKDKKNGQNICTKKTRTYIGEKKGGLSNKKVPEGLTQKHANKKINGKKTLLFLKQKKLKIWARENKTNQDELVASTYVSLSHIMFTKLMVGYADTKAVGFYFFRMAHHLSAYFWERDG